MPTQGLARLHVVQNACQMRCGCGKRHHYDVNCAGLLNQFAMAFCLTKTPNEFIVNDGVFRPLIRAYDRLQRFQICVKTSAICICYFICFATLVIHLINIVPALFVPEGELCIIRRCVQIIDHVCHCRNCAFTMVHFN